MRTTKKSVEAILGAPAGKGDEWRCAFKLKGLYRNKIFYDIGIDGFQALHSALDGIRVKLRESGLDLFVPGTDPPYRGFPMFIPEVLGLDVYARLERLVEDRVEPVALAYKRAFHRKLKRHRGHS